MSTSDETPCETPASELHPIYLKMPPNNIVIFKFILESYEMLAVLRTLSSDDGEVVLMALEDTAPIVLEIVEELRGELELRIVCAGDRTRNDF